MDRRLTPDPGSLQIPPAPAGSPGRMETTPLNFVIPRRSARLTETGPPNRLLNDSPQTAGMPASHGRKAFALGLNFQQILTKVRWKSGLAAWVPRPFDSERRTIPGSDIFFRAASWPQALGTLKWIGVAIGLSLALGQFK